jgi:hypothetical protein
MKLAVVAAAMTLLAIAGCASRPPASPSLIELHMQARGGSTAVRAIQSIELRLDLVEPTFALQGDYLANRNNCMRIDISNGGRYLQSEGVSAEGGWAVAAGDTSYSPQAAGGTETLLHGIDHPARMLGLDEFPQRGHRLTVVGRTSIGTTAFDEIDVVYADGYTAELYLDPRTHLIARMREHKPMHVAIDPTKQSIETQFSDYRRVGGVLFPFFSREVNWDTGKELGHTTVRSVVLNSEAAAAACKRPVLPRAG